MFHRRNGSASGPGCGTKYTTFSGLDQELSVLIALFEEPQEYRSLTGDGQIAPAFFVGLPDGGGGIRWGAERGAGSSDHGALHGRNVEGPTCGVDDDSLHGFSGGRIRDFDQHGHGT